MAQPRRTFRAIEGTLGRVDLAIFGAASYHQVDAADFRAEDFAKDVQINVLGVANCLEELRDLTAPNVRFKDPFNDVRGQKRMIRVFADLFKIARDVRFEGAGGRLRR